MATIGSCIAMSRRGTMRVVTEQGAWLIPPTRGVWIPPLVKHEVFMGGEVRMRSLFIDPALAPHCLQQCCVLAVMSLLSELILRAVQGPEHAKNPLIQLLMLEEIIQLKNLPFHIPMPNERRLQVICRALLCQPDANFSLEDWAQQVGASSRTLSRLFDQQLGMSFLAWRQQVRLMEALPRLVVGEPIQRVARSVSYGSTRAFSAMFQAALGDSPRDYVKSLDIRSTPTVARFDIL